MARRSRSLIALGALALAGALPATAAAQAPAGPPGPPPGHGLDVPVSPGTAPSAVPAGTPATVTGGAPGPGLLSGDAVVFDRARRAFVLAFACQANGRVTVSGSVTGGSVRAQASYRCKANRAAPRFTVSAATATRIARAGKVAATATVRQGSRSTKLWFVLSTRARAASPGFWTDGNLHCALDGAAPQKAFLAQPNFTTRSFTPLSTRAWIAWHTPAGGWHWLGVNGENAGRWDPWTSLVNGITQFFPAGADTPVPWSWGPITIPTGQGITAVGVFEVLYWVAGRPEYQWRYVNAGSTGAAAAGSQTLGCVYP